MLGFVLLPKRRSEEVKAMRKAGNSQIMRTITLLITIFSLSLPAYAKYSGGTGEPNDPYQIATAEDLMLLGDSPEDYDKHFILTADIDLDPNLPGRKVFDMAVIAPDTNDTENGFQGTGFTGIFDGNDHIIFFLNINGAGYLGLFGQLDSEAQVRNLRIVGVNIVGSDRNVGGLVGFNYYGAIIQCHSSGTVTGTYDVGGLVGTNGWDLRAIISQISQCSSEAYVSGTGGIGGLLGCNEFGTVAECYSTGTVTGANLIGGLVGQNWGDVTQCYSTATITGSSGVGGLVGHSEGAISGCHSAGMVSGNDDVGGLVGWIHGGILRECYSISTVSGDSKIGGLVGYSSSYGIIIASCSTGAVSGTDDVGGLVGYNSVVLNLCYSTSTVFATAGNVGGLVGNNNGGDVTQCYSTGGVSGDSSVGGLVGSNSEQGVLTACCWDIETSGQTNSAGGVGLTTAKMHDIQAYLSIGWDFVNEIENGTSQVWQIPEGGGYPDLAILNGYTPPRLQGTGTHEDPFLVSNALELGAMVYYDPNAYYRLAASIDLLGTNWGLAVIPWFSGTFDGNDHAILHLTITGGSHVGLFGQLDSKATIKDLGVVDVNISGSGSDIGGLVGSNGGLVTHCYSTGTVGGMGNTVGGLVGYVDCGIVTHCCSAGTVVGGNCVGGLVGSTYGAAITASFSGGSVSGQYCVGGLVGDSRSSIAACYSSASVTGDHDVGGLVGDNDYDGRSWGSIANSYSTGAIRGNDEVGGLVGWNLGQLVDCYSTGAIRGNDEVGGLVGSDYSREMGWGTVIACFWDIETSGQMTSDGGDGKTTAEMQDPNTFIATGWDFAPNDVWFEPAGGGYPILWWQLAVLPSLPQFSGGTGEPNDPYLISTAEELNRIGHNRRLMECHFKLIGDIDLTGFHFYPIGSLDDPYRGVFDGDGFTISNLTITGGEYLGLFGCLGSGAEVRYLGVVDVNITSSGDWVGGLAGCNSGTLTRCYSTGTVSGDDRVGGLVGLNWGVVADCHSTGAVSGDYGVGGLLGVNSSPNGIVSNCYSTGAVSGRSQVGGLVGDNSIDSKVSWSCCTGAVSGYSQVGGLVGWNWHTVTRCYSTGRVSGKSSDVGGLVGRNAGDVSHCYTTGTVSGNLLYVGWLVGSGDPEKVTSSFWEIKKSGQVTSAGGTGKTTVEMQTASTFLEAGWDFVDETENGPNDVWKMWDGYDYPRLIWETGLNTPLVFVDINDPGFYGQMSKYEVTNAQYCDFLNAVLTSGDITINGNDVYGADGSNSGEDYVGQRYYHCDGSGYTGYGATNGGAARIHYSEGAFSVDEGFGNHPVTYVSWYGAMAFANYYGYYLPTEDQWQAVADYDGTYIYGCGETINPGIANYRDSEHPDGTTPVGSFGQYGYSMSDMAGNVWEWTCSSLGDSRIFCGGSLGSIDSDCEVSIRGDGIPYAAYYDIGFRVCR